MYIGLIIAENDKNNNLLINFSPIVRGTFVQLLFQILIALIKKFFLPYTFYEQPTQNNGPL